MGQESGPIDAVIEDLTDLPKFHGMTAADDLFDNASLTPMIFEGMTALSTVLSLKRDNTWSSVRGHLQGS